MSAGPRGRDGEVEAFIVDRYLESLLARRPADDGGVPADLMATAALLNALPRFHPSFRFEEELAALLSSAARRSDGGALVPFPQAPRPDSAAAERAFGRPALIGGVLTSAALSLAGVVFIARRMARPAAEAAPSTAVTARLT